MRGLITHIIQQTGADAPNLKTVRQFWCNVYLQYVFGEPPMLGFQMSSFRGVVRAMNGYEFNII